jgi:membrane protein
LDKRFTVNPLPCHRRRVFRIDDTSIRLDEGPDAMLWTVAKEAAANWSSHKDSRQGAALAYYSVFSLGPIIVIAIAIAGFVFGLFPARSLPRQRTC